MRRTLLYLLTILVCLATVQNIVAANITFKDEKVKELCVANWDTDNDGELSEHEAAMVKSLGDVFRNNREIMSFSELQHFKGLNGICSFAFNGCTALKEVSLPESLTKIGYLSFGDCAALESICIPKTVTCISNSSFAYCISLKSIKVEKGNAVYDSRNNCNGIVETATGILILGCKTTVIPESVTAVTNNTF